MTNELIPNADMQVFSPADIARARLILNQPALDESSIIKTLIVQRDTGLSMARGEISIMMFNGRPQVMINKQGYLAYASRQLDYDGYESDVETIDEETVAWCKVYNKNRSHPVCVKIYQKEYAKQTPIWREKPRYMLEKTAISLALRAAFPILNGTYTDDEIEADAPVKIEPKSTDIKVEVKPYVPPMSTGTTTSTTAKKDPVKNYTCNTVTKEEVNLRLIPAYQRQGFKLGVFADADLGDGKFNKDMIDEDFRKQAGLSNPAPAPEPESHGEDGLKQFTAEVVADAERERKLKEAQKGVVENIISSASKQTKPSATLSGDVCEVCGCKLLEKDIKMSKDFCDNHLFCETHAMEYVANKSKSAKN